MGTPSAMPHATPAASEAIFAAVAAPEAIVILIYFTGCWLTYPSEKYESQLG